MREQARSTPPARQVTSMITAGSVRGKCCVPQPVQTITLPALRGAHSAPQTPQKRCRARQYISPRACASTEASAGGSRPATWRRSVKLTSPKPASAGSGSASAERSSANTARSPQRPSSACGRRSTPSATAVSTVSSTASGRPASTPRSRLFDCHTGTRRLAGSASRAATKAASSRRLETRSSGLPV